MMAEGHRLRDLEVGEPGHHRRRVAPGQSDQRRLHALQQRHHAIEFAAQPEADVGGDLVVARSSRVQPLAGIPHEIGQAFLDVQVNVLEFQVPLEAALFDLAADPGEPALDVGEVGCTDDAGAGQHGGVRQRALDVGEGEAPVEADRGGVAEHEIGHRFVESTRPGTAFRGQWIRGLRRVL